MRRKSLSFCLFYVLCFVLTESFLCDGNSALKILVLFAFDKFVIVTTSERCKMEILENIQILPLRQLLVFLTHDDKLNLRLVSKR